MNIAPETCAENGKPAFEVALEQLQSTVKKLEGGELSLEQALKCFEDGVRLSRVCQEHLSVAEQRVEVLMKGTGTASVAPETRPFPTTK
jgi:exodeoxyribonuclease VII small subunit